MRVRAQQAGGPLASACTVLGLHPPSSSAPFHAPPPPPQFTPKPAPVMSPTRANLLAPLAAPAGGAAGVGPGGDGKLTKAEERAVGQVDKAVYLTYFRWVDGLPRFLIHQSPLPASPPAPRHRPRPLLACSPSPQRLPTRPPPWLLACSSWSPAFIIPLVVLTLSMVERGLQVGAARTARTARIASAGCGGSAHGFASLACPRLRLQAPTHLICN